MFSLKIVKFSLVLFYVILCTKTMNVTKETLVQIQELLKYPRWKNLNDVNSIKYIEKIYNLKSIIEKPTRLSEYAQKVRILTVYLGCSYAKVMNNLFLIIIKCLQISNNKNKEKNDLLNGYINTEELINIIALFIVPTATLMKGALDTLDLLRKSLLTTSKIKDYQSYIMILILEKIEDIINKLNNPFLSCDVTNFSTFEILHSFSNNVIDNLKYETELYCEFVPYDTNYLWNEWNQKYKAIIDKGVKIVFVKFLTRKINDYIKTVIIEKYIQLGFNFDPITEETFVPTSEELIEPNDDLEFK
ncbi:uncharacterized protein LOC126907064 [Daktulosphaira vitifoliae]|uniref:uncharacterized protein LOC126907064 n=1 Tax=Daktulosphaira vitifoliae TaxID=58002 RepID=UPI0021AA2D1B|nr:uncharacterized protein LOC126907064 [Daktulosphaira vitifoliae]